MFERIKIEEYSKRKLDLFLTKSVSAYWLACHAALPLFFRSDWLFHLWANFKDDIYIVTKNVSPYSDIVDIANSPFTNVVGIDLYEFDNEIRDYLIFQLEQKFGAQYLEQLASFLFQYAEKVNLTDEDKNVHQITAWSIVYPHQAAIAIGNEFTKSIEDNDKEEQNRLFFIMEAMTSSFETEVKKPFKQILNVAEINKDQNLGFEFKSPFINTESKPSANTIQIKIPIDLIPESNIKTIDNPIIERLNNILSGFDGNYLTEIEPSEIMILDGTMPKFNYTLDENGNITGLRIININIANVIREIFKNSNDWNYLNELNFENCGISDLSFLNSIQNLNKLNLSHNYLSDISFLRRSKNLNELNLNHNLIIDVSIISNLIELRDLSLSENEIKDLSPLKELKQLKRLEIAGNKNKGVKVIDISGKTEFSQRVAETNISPLSGLIQLITLNLSNSNITDISKLNSLINLEELILSGNQISEISSLKDLMNLKILDLRFNKIRQLDEWICLLGMDFELEKSGFGIGLEGNPFEEHLIEIIKKGKKALKEYLQNLRTDQTPESKEITDNEELSEFKKDDLADVENSEGVNQLGMGYIDFHCHSALKPLGKSFNSNPGVNNPNMKSKDSIWNYDPPSMLDKVAINTGLFTKFKQADFTSLAKGGAKIVCVSLGGLEKGFVMTKIGAGLPGDIIGNMVTSIGKKWTQYLQNMDDYFNHLLMEYDFYKQLEGHKVKIDGNWQQYKIVSSFNEISESDDPSVNTIFVILSIEGTHLFNTGLQMMGKIANINEVLTTVDHLKNWDKRLFFVGLSHHFNNEMVGHAKSMGGMISKFLDQTEGMNDGFTDLGWKLLRKLLDNTNGRRILVDLKHMSVKSRKEYYQFLENEHPDETIPLIFSHGAVNGFRSPIDKVEDDLFNYGKFKSDDINLYDDEIVRIAKTGGIFGIQFDERRIGSELELKKTGPNLSHRKMLFYKSKLVWNQIQHIAEVLNRHYLFAWGIQCIGSNFDGMVNPLNGFWTAAEMPIFESYLEKHAYNFLNSTESDSLKEYNKLSGSEIVERFMYDNAYTFLKRNF